jgi:exopolyphosphatase/pppGpp-phosphohydrolase
MNRFDNAALKLYNAFNKGELNAMDACACAVGNLCNNKSFWSKHNFSFNIVQAEFTTGYNIKEIDKIECLFMYGSRNFGDNHKWDPNLMTKQNQFDALMCVLDYLAELDNIEVPKIQIEKFKQVLTT